MSNYQGWYLNLERNQPRRAALERHLEEIGGTNRYRRFDAVDGRAVAHLFPTRLDPGNLGLWLSHVKLLEHRRSSAEHLHIIEDDTILARDAPAVFDKMLESADAHPDGWDLIFTDILVPIDRVDFVHLLAKHIAAFRQSGSRAILDLAGIPFSCTSSFFVNRQSIDKYAGLIADQWTWGKPIDLFLRHLINQGRLKAFVTVPFMTSISETSQQSDIADVTSRSVAVGSAFQRAIFEEADLGAVEAEIDRLTSGTADESPLTRIYLKTLRFRLSDQWSQF